MTALAKADEGFLGGIPMMIAERNRDHLAFPEKGRQSGVTRYAEASDQNNGGLYKSWRSNPNDSGTFHSLREISGSLLLTDNGYYG